MSLDGFLNGMVSGGIAMNKLMNDNSDQRIKEQQAEEARYKFGKQKEFDESMKKIDENEAAANAKSEEASYLVSDSDSNNQIMEQALNENAAGIKDAGATPLSDEQKISLQDAIAKQNLPISQKVSQIKQAKAINQAVNTGKASSLDEINSIESSNRPKLDKEAYGIKADPVNKYRFALQRAAAFNKLGDFKSANEIKSIATQEATGEFANAILSGDRNTAFDMYQTFPNGHYLKSLRFGKDAKGNDTVITEDTSGNKAVSNKMDILLGAVAHSGSPKEAIALLASRMTSDEKNQLSSALNNMKVEQITANIQHQKDMLELQKQNLQARYDLSGGSRSGSGSGSGRGGKPQEGYNDDGTLTQEAFFNGLKATDDASADAQTKAYANYRMMAEQSGDVTPAYQWQIARAAKDLASGRVRAIPELQADGTWNNQVINANGVGVPYQKNINPSTVNGADGQPILTNEKVIGQIQAKFPAQYDQAFKFANKKGSVATLQQLIANPNANPKDKKDAQILVNLATQIQQYGGTQRIITPVNTNKVTTNSNFTNEEIAQQKKLGITPNKPLMQSVKDVANNVSTSWKDGSKAIAKQAFDEQLNILKSGNTSSYTANRLYQMMQSNPDFKVSPEDLIKIQAYSTDYQTSKR